MVRLAGIGAPVCFIENLDWLKAQRSSQHLPFVNNQDWNQLFPCGFISFYHFFCQHICNCFFLKKALASAYCTTEGSFPVLKMFFSVCCLPFFPLECHYSPAGCYLNPKRHPWSLMKIEKKLLFTAHLIQFLSTTGNPPSWIRHPF